MTKLPNRRIARMFTNGAKPVIPFLTAGFPTMRVSEVAIRAMADAGAGAIEIGMPFSDPIADGPAIQRASNIALVRGVTLSDVLRLAETMRRQIDVPILLMGSINPLLRFGVHRFARTASRAGVDGLIIPDCPLEESAELGTHARETGLSNVMLIAPTSSDDRIRQLDRRTSDFSYCMAVAGITGVRDNVSRATIAYLGRVRRIARKPFVVGFGISKSSHIARLRNHADGFVVGSALVPLLADGRVGVRSLGRLVGRLTKAAGG